jgi:hypothetical protein
VGLFDAAKRASPDVAALTIVVNDLWLEIRRLRAQLGASVMELEQMRRERNPSIYAPENAMSNNRSETTGTLAIALDARAAIIRDLIVRRFRDLASTAFSGDDLTSHRHDCESEQGPRFVEPDVEKQSNTPSHDAPREAPLRKKQ